MIEKQQKSKNKVKKNKKIQILLKTYKFINYKHFIILDDKTINQKL